MTTFENSRVFDVAVLGAGPKAAAIAAKAHVLNHLGLANIRIAIFEGRELGATWTGNHGFTTGHEELGTRPEKDVGFPYQSMFYGRHDTTVDAAMALFSWQSYLISRGEYRRWVDNGVPCPSHAEFADYLSWVLSRTTHGIRIDYSQVVRVEHCEGRWVISHQAPSSKAVSTVVSKGVVVTGPGAPKGIPCAFEIKNHVFSFQSSRTATLSDVYPHDSRICIIGAGESAISTALFLIESFGKHVRLTFVTPSLPYSRAESSLENTVYSAPYLCRWDQLPEPVRIDFINRTDRGVMSPKSLALLFKHKSLSFVLGKATAINRSDSGGVQLVIDQSNEIVRSEFDFVVNCGGFCPVSPFVALLDSAKEGIERTLGFQLTDASMVARRLDKSFAIRGLKPKLHFPALAGLLYGPGFSNLSCLGSLSDHVLAPYCKAHGETGEPLARDSVADTELTFSAEIDNREHHSEYPFG